VEPPPPSSIFLTLNLQNWVLKVWNQEREREREREREAKME
jgi:hypothetical protein